MGKMIHAWRWAILVIMLLLSGSTLASIVLGNAGMLALRDGLMAQVDFVPGDYPFYAALDVSKETEHIAQTLRHAVALNPGSSSLRWALGRAALAVGDAKAAVGALEPLVEKATHQPLLYSDALMAFSQSGRLEAVTALYELAPPQQQQMQTISDTVALAYLEQGGRDVLERAIALRPGDLYANYFLWKQAQEAGDMEATATYSETLTYFPLEAVDPTDEQLLDYAAEVIPNLLEDGLWDRDKILNVVSFLVWQHNEVPGVERLLEQLIERYPTEPEWPFYLAELYHRRGDLEQAAGTYRQVLAVDPAYAQAYLRLGMVAEANCKLRIANCEGMEEAVGWYEQYRELAPDDLLGLKKLTEMCELLGCLDYVMLREELDAKVNDQHIVAQLLDLPMEDVSLGSRLVQNGGFEASVADRPERWAWSDMFNREPFCVATFVGGTEDFLAFEGQSYARVDGFWVQPSENQEPARAGFRHWDKTINDICPITLMVGLPYVLSFDYRTTRVPNGNATVWVSGNPDVFWMYDYGLSSTDGRWHHFAAVGWNQGEGEAPIRPLVRLFTSGNFEFDNVQVRRISLAEGVAVEVADVKFWVSGGNQ